MKVFLDQTAAIVAKDVRIELRTREILYTSLLFSIVLVTVFLFSGFGELADIRRAAPGAMWVCITFVGTLIFARTFQREREQRALLGLLLVPNVTDSLYVGKLLVNLALLGVVELLLVPIVALAFRIDLVPVAGPMFALLALGSFGYCALGTVLAAALASVRLREVILPLVLYPLCLPLLVAGAKGTAVLLETGEAAAAGDWLKLLVAFDVLFVVLSRWLFSHALEGG